MIDKQMARERALDIVLTVWECVDKGGMAKGRLTDSMTNSRPKFAALPCARTW